MFKGKDLLESQLTAANILLRVSDEQIFSTYICKIGNSVFSPFREEKHKSCGFYRNTSGVMLLRDFALDQSWNCFDAIGKKLNLNFGDTLKFLNHDLQLGLGTPNPKAIDETLTTKNIENTKPELEITYSIKPYETHELEYWTHHGISSDILMKYGVYCVKIVKFGDGGWRSTKKNPIFIFTTKDPSKFKFYRPYASSGGKWLSKVKQNGIWGLTQIPDKGKLLIITKSLKDVMVLYSLGFPAVCPNSETCTINKNILIELKKRFTHVISFFDYDPTGISAALKLDLPYMFLFKKKDVSDYIAQYGAHNTFKRLKKILSKTFHRYEKFLFHRYAQKAKELTRDDEIYF